MASKLIDFLESRRVINRFRIFVVGGIVLVLALLLAGGFYFYKKRFVRKPSSGQVAAAVARRLPAEWVYKHFGTTDENDLKVGGPNGDPDHDLLTNYKEYLFGTNPLKEDTDGDGEIDSFEVAFGRNPNGPGNLTFTQGGPNDYVKSLIASNKDYQNFSQEKIEEQLTSLLEPDRAVVMDFPKDSELTIISQNDVPAFEKYYNDIQSLTPASEEEIQKVQDDLFSLGEQDLNAYINKLKATEELLMQVQVPSELLGIHRLKIAGLRAGIRMFELVRDSYRQDSSNQQFWKDFFYQSAIAQNAETLEFLAWREVSLMLKDKGGF